MYDRGLNRRALENMIRCGTFDSMGYRRSQLLSAMLFIMDDIAADRKRNVEGQFDLFGGLDGSSGKMRMFPCRICRNSARPI